MTTKIIIIGAGASGLLAAIAAGRLFLDSYEYRKDNAPILIFERMDKAGKKILATGNGRCNFTNMNMSMECFHSNTPELVEKTISAFSHEDTLKFFDELGILIKNKDGYIYPRSGQAASIRDVLLMEINRLPIQLKTGCEIKEIRPYKKGYEVYDMSGQVYRAEKVIVASGGCAYPKLGSNGSGYTFAKNAGLRVVRPVPALTGLYAREKYFNKIAGVRTDAEVYLYEETIDSKWKLIGRDRGEVQLTEYGVSGIPVFQVSGAASRALAGRKKVSIKVDFMPDMTYKELFIYLSERIGRHPEKQAEDFLTGMFNYKLCSLFMELAGIPKSKITDRFDRRDVGKLTGIIKEFYAEIIKTGSFDNAQVCAGGVDGRELNDVLESKKNPGLYFVGEVVDVDGICGGYNLQWAWSSGYVAGRHGARRCLRKGNL